MPPTPLGSQAVTTLRTYLTDHWQSPEQYIVNLFMAKDVVLLAEDHGIRHNLTLIHNLIPLLHAAGVFQIGMEFGAFEDQPALDQLVQAEIYDEHAARRLMFNYNTGWAYREYMEVYRAAWAFNRTLTLESPKFRVLNLSYRYHWADAPIVRTPANAQHIYHLGSVDAYRAQVVRQEVLDRGEKVLILTGSVHAFTRYEIPVYDFNADNFVRFENRNLGHLLYQHYHERVACVLLHQPFHSRWHGGAELVFPAQGALDQVMTGFENKRVGFDLRGTPLGALPDDSFYASGYAGFTLGDLADGYLYQMPFEAYQGCTLDPDFLTAANWDEARREFADPDWHQRPTTLEEYWSQIRAYVDVAHRYRALR